MGYDREDLAAGRVNRTDLTPPEWRERDARTVAEVKATGTVQPLEKEYFRKDGSRMKIATAFASILVPTRNVHPVSVSITLNRGRA